MKKIFSLATIVLTLFGSLFSNFIFAYQADRDPSFDTGVLKGSFNSYVKTITTQSDGKILVGGSFDSYAENYSNPTNKIIRLNPDGSRDYSFDMGNGFDKDIYSIAVQSDGKILVGGQFTSYQGETANGIIRLNSDGSKDSSFNMGNGFNLGSRGFVYDIQIQSDGKILAVGNFIGYNGQTVNGAVRINTDGSIDDSFDMSTWFDDQVIISTVAIQPDNKILLGGSFTSFSGEATNAIIRLNANGSRDSSFIMGSGFGEREEVYKIILQNDGKILVGGEFNTYKGIAAKNIIRLHTDGTRDSSFDMGSGFNDRGYVYTINTQDDGKILVGGGFSSYQGETANGIIRLNSDGSKDLSFNMGNGFNDGANIYSMKIQSNGKILIGGNFDSYNGKWKNNIIRLNTDGTRDSSLDKTAFDPMVKAITLQNDGKILVGGSFTEYNTEVVNGIIRLNSNGTRDSSFIMGSGFNSDVLTIALQSDGKILVGGNFTEYNGQAANHIIRLNSDGSRDSSFAIGNGFIPLSYINSITIQSDGKILVGGNNFTEYNGEIVKEILRLHTDGSRDTSFDIGTGFDNCNVNKITLQNDGKILVVGEKDQRLGNPSNCIIRLNTNGSKDNSFLWQGIDNGDGFTSAIIQSDGKILVGGNFAIYSGDNYIYKHIVRLNADGSRDASFVVGTGFDRYSQYVKGIQLQHDGKIVAVGNFEFYNDEVANGIIRLNPDGSRDYSFDIENAFGYSPSVDTVYINNYGKIYVGGLFTSYKNQDAPYLIALYGDSVVNLPNSNDTNIIQEEFTNKGYATGNTYLEGTAPISLHQTDGLILDEINIKNENILVSFSENTQFKKANGITNYSGLFLPPKHVTIDQVNNKPVISAIKLGNFTESLTLDGTANIKIPTPSKNIGDIIKVYSSQDGYNRTDEGTGLVVDYHGQKYAEINVNHFTYFAIAENVEGSFSINNDDSSTTTQSVTLHNDVPGATLMRFSNTSGSNWSSWIVYTTTYPWILSEGLGSKTVYAQFDIDGEIFEVSDSIFYNDGSSNQGNIILTITGGVTECVYGTSMNMNAQDVQIGIPYTFTGTFPSTWYCQDYDGIVGGWALTIQTTDLYSENNNIISGSNLLISHDPVVIEGDSACTGYNGTATQFYSSPYPVFTKTSGTNKICKVSASNVSLLVNVPANQAPGNYSGTLTIYVPNF